MLVDSHGRSIDYLRLAVTDRCNLRCRYCMPEEGVVFASREDILSYEEIIRLSSILSAQGVRKIRITGGEPFVRKDLIHLLEEINKFFSVINVTSNATVLQKHIPDLKKLKIGSFNISLDSLDKHRFMMITKRDMFETVWNTILDLLNQKIRVKINMVVMRGINDMEIIDFAQLAERYPIDVRFIEAMPFNSHDGNTHLYIPMPEIYETLQRQYPTINKSENQEKKSASVKYEVEGFNGNIGIIPAYSRTLCGFCNRMRITAKGELMTCLYSEKGLDLKNLMLKGATDEDLIEAIQHKILTKEKDGFEAEKNRSKEDHFQSMTTIGG